MNYDLCDLLNQKMESLFGYRQKNNNKSNFKNSNNFDSYLEQHWPEQFFELYVDDSLKNEKFAHWIYRNGKISDQINDFDFASKKILREISNMTYSNFPSLDIMYFSGVLKLIYSENNFIYIETATKPSLDQLMAIKDFQKNINCSDENVFWSVCTKRSRNYFDYGSQLNKLFQYNFGRIK